MLALAATTSIVLAGGAAGVEGIGIPAQIVDVTKETLVQEHPTTDYAGTGSTADDRVGTTRWRVVKDTGNCCENHLTTSSDGRLFDIGGNFVNYTDDRGVTWKSVRPINPLVNAEGSIAVAPNGDVIAMTWDAYSGDHWVSYKYNAESGKWFTLDNKIHHPFYDRPWLTVVPGPFAIGLGADTVPYISFVHGGFPIKDPMFVSTDGLKYVEASSLIVDGLTDVQVSSWFPIKADASFDWIQPIRSSPVTPLGDGRALAAGSWLLNPEDRKWDQWRLPDGSAPPTFIQIDSAGRIHHVRSASGGRTEYRISADGGRTWNSAFFPVPFGGQLDFKVNRAAGVSALAQRLSNQDWVVKFDITGDTAKLLRRYRVGLGDASAGSSIGALTSPRMDFQTIAIFPDGRVAASFLDSTTFSHPPGSGMLGRLTPAVVIELDTTLPAHQPDLAAGAVSLSTQRVKGADEVTFSADVANVGLGDAAGVAVQFSVNGEALGAQQTIESLAAGSAATIVSEVWSARHRETGDYTVELQVDPANAIAETDESNNVSTATFFVEGNKVRNGSFEQSASGSSPDAWSSSGETGYESGGSDGEQSVSAGPGGSWTSEAIPVDAGASYAASVATTGAGGTLAVEQLSAAGELVGVSTGALLSTFSFATGSVSFAALEGVASVRVVLSGGLTGTTTFDDVRLVAG